MIYVDVKGNIGNQLFIYAFARSIQEKTGQKICFNTTYLSKYYPQYHFELDHYKLNDKVSFDKTNKLPFFMNIYTLPVRAIIRIIQRFSWLDSRISTTIYKLFSKFGYYFWLKENYIDVKVFQKKNYYITGFWQCPQYFDAIRPMLLNELKPQQAPLSENEQLYQIIRSNNTICVSVRRGDYVSNSKIRDNYYLCGPEYFFKGVQAIKEASPDAVVICFSDDIEWVKNNIEFGCPTYYESGKDPVWEKLRLMSSCKNFVLSNSSFSWWAEYLSNSGGIVVAPSRWYVDNRPTDIYREGWQYITV